TALVGPEIRVGLPLESTASGAGFQRASRVAQFFTTQYGAVQASGMPEIFTPRLIFPGGSMGYSQRPALLTTGSESARWPLAQPAGAEIASTSLGFTAGEKLKLQNPLEAGPGCKTTALPLTVSFGGVTTALVVEQGKNSVVPLLPV